jgi:hypothetical protein
LERGVCEAHSNNIINSSVGFCYPAQVVMQGKTVEDRGVYMKKVLLLTGVLLALWVIKVAVKDDYAL